MKFLIVLAFIALAAVDAGPTENLSKSLLSGIKNLFKKSDVEKLLFQVKGIKNVRVRQVDPKISSMNKGDCFILNINDDIFVYLGEKSNNFERTKATLVANQIKDQDHNGRGSVKVIDQQSSKADVKKFFSKLGSRSKDVVPEESAGGDDQTFEKNEERTVKLTEVSGSIRKLKPTPLKAPFHQKQLKPQGAYILDTVSGSIYVWIGKQATEKVGTEAMSIAEQYLLVAARKHSSWAQVARIPQDLEPAIFKQYFSTWSDVKSQSPVVSAGLASRGLTQ